VNDGDKNDHDGSSSPTGRADVGCVGGPAPRPWLYRCGMTSGV